MDQGREGWAGGVWLSLSYPSESSECILVSGDLLSTTLCDWNLRQNQHRISAPGTHCLGSNSALSHLCWVTLTRSQPLCASISGVLING